MTVFSISNKSHIYVESRKLTANSVAYHLRIVNPVKRKAMPRRAGGWFTKKTVAMGEQQRITLTYRYRTDSFTPKASYERFCKDYPGVSNTWRANSRARIKRSKK